MLRNLIAEQARIGLTNQQMAEALGISRTIYEARLKDGNFKASHIIKLIELFKCDFFYLFNELIAAA